MLQPILLGTWKKTTSDTEKCNGTNVMLFKILTEKIQHPFHSKTNANKFYNFMQLAVVQTITLGTHLHNFELLYVICISQEKQLPFLFVNGAVVQ